MASIIKRTNGDYTAVYTDRNGKRHWIATGTSNRKQAIKFVKTHVTPLERPRRLQLSGIRDRILDYADGRFSHGTVAIYRKAFTALLAVIGDKPVRTITPLDVDQFVNARLKSVSRTTVNIDLRTLKSAFRIVVERNLVQSNPFARTKLLVVPYVEPPHLSMVQVRSLIDSTSDATLRDVMAFAVMTMMRLGEIVNLTWDDIDDHRKTVRVANKVGFTVKGRRPRSVPMNIDVQKIISRRRSSGGSAFVFAKDGKQLNPKTLSRQFKTIVRRSGIDSRIHFHSLRHTGASILAQQGISVLTIQRILGHSSVSMTQRYSHVIDANLVSAVETLSFRTVATDTPLQLRSN